MKCWKCFGFLAKGVPWLNTGHHSSESVTVENRHGSVDGVFQSEAGQ